MKPVEGGRITVLTFKEGLLSKVAHDLQLSLERFKIQTDGSRVEAEFFPDSLVVEGAMRRGILDSGALSDGDRREIGANLREKVLRTEEHPSIKLTARAARDDGRLRLVGPLTMMGKSVELAFDVDDRGGFWRGEVELTPSRWGIHPFKALLGAIKLQDRVVVRFELPVVELD